jgi:hypothetical protein
MSPLILSPIKKTSVMYDVTFKDAIKLTGKTKRTIQRYLASGKLTYVDGNDGIKLFDRVELLESVGIVTHVTHDASPSNVTPTDNTQQLALIIESNSLAKQQLAASKQTNALLSELVGLLKDQPLVVSTEPIIEPEPIKEMKSGSDYLYGMSFIKSSK